MSTPKAFITSISKKKKLVTVRFSLSDGSRKKKLYWKSDLTVYPDFWDAKRERMKETADVKAEYTLAERQQFANDVEKAKQMIQSLYEELPEQEKQDLDSDKFDSLIDMKLHPEKYGETDDHKNDLFYQFDRYFKFKNYPESHLRPYQVVVRLLKRFEAIQKIRRGSFSLTLDSLDEEVLLDIMNFVRDEYKYVDNARYKQVYEQYPEERKPKLRGRNTVIKYMKRIRSFVKWCMTEELLDKDPFGKIQLGSPTWGTPIYITIEERNQIAETDLEAVWNKLSVAERKSVTKHNSAHTITRLQEQRDIFVFQCLIGCRVGDLLKFTPKNIVNGAIEYIARKTSDNRPVTIRVPLNERAQSILSRYWDGKRMTGKLLPFESAQKYDDDIKTIFYLCGITRNVVTLDQKTGKEITRPINEIASSHMARRTFVGNLYKRTGYNKDLVSSMSGHAPNSKAFNRYFKIDEESKDEAIKLLD